MLAPAVAQAAMDSGIALRPPLLIPPAYARKNRPVHPSHRPDDEAGVRTRAPTASASCVTEGEEYTVLRAVQTVIGSMAVILIGRPNGDRKRIAKLGLRMRPGVDFELTNINDDPRFDDDCGSGTTR